MLFHFFNNAWTMSKSPNLPLHAHKLAQAKVYQRVVKDLYDQLTIKKIDTSERKQQY